MKTLWVLYNVDLEMNEEEPSGDSENDIKEFSEGAQKKKKSVLCVNFQFGFIWSVIQDSVYKRGF